MSAAHTPTPSPLPWSYESGPSFSGKFETVHSGETMVCECYEGTNEEQAANAKLIVRAVNNHQALLDALEGLVDRFKAYSDSDCNHQDAYQHLVKQAYGHWNAALKAVAAAREQSK